MFEGLTSSSVNLILYGCTVFILDISCFLLGLFLIRWSLQKMVGKRTKELLTRMTKSPFTGVMTGILLATLLQSSSIVLILVINLVSIGALPLLNGIAIVLGANLGTSLTLEFIAFSDPIWILFLFVLSIALFLFKKPAQGTALFSLVLILVGFTLFKQNASLLTHITLARPIADTFTTHVLTLLGGILFTAIIQSSTAATAFTMTLVDNQVVPLLTGVLVVYGSNIGTCSTAILAALGASLQAKKIMLYHVFINILCVLLLLPLTPLLISLIMHLTDDGLKQVAHAQVLFNVMTIIFFYPFIRQHVRLLNRFFS